MRKVNNSQFTAFLAVCEELDLDPETVRKRVRGMDVTTIITGRPAETRKRDVKDDVYYHDHSVHGSIDIASIGDQVERSTFENHFSISTLTSM